MSEKRNGVLITAPIFGTGKEVVGEFTGYSCGRCQGNGYYIDPDIITERVKKNVSFVRWHRESESSRYYRLDT